MSVLRETPSAAGTRVRILAATHELYCRGGSRGTTTREIALIAGVNEATVFRHFRTKQQLLGAMLDHYSDAAGFVGVLEEIRLEPTIEGELRALALHAIERLRRKETLIKVAMAEEIVDPDGAVCAWRSPRATRDELRRYFGEKTDAGILRGEPPWLARIFLSLLFAYVVARPLWCDLDAHDDDAAARTIVEIFLNGARAN